MGSNGRTTVTEGSVNKTHQISHAYQYILYCKCESEWKICTFYLLQKYAHVQVFFSSQKHIVKRRNIILKSKRPLPCLYLHINDCEVTMSPLGAPHSAWTQTTMLVLRISCLAQQSQENLLHRTFGSLMYEKQFWSVQFNLGVAEKKFALAQSITCKFHQPLIHVDPHVHI